MKRVRMRVDANAGASFTSTAVFFSFLATAKAVASEALSLLAAHDLEERQDRDRVERSPTTRSGVLQLRRHLRHREGGGVGGDSTACAGATASTSGQLPSTPISRRPRS